MKRLIGWLSKLRPQRDTLIVMRAANMHRVHPGTDWSRECDRCGEPVGIYPSGQRLLAERKNVEIVCDACSGDAWFEATPLPGVRQEAIDSVPRKK